MAIKVGGTAVINNSLGLEAIASLDSTSATSIRNAGVTLVDVDTFTSSGTWTKPSVGTVAIVTCIGGGGGGGAANANAGATGGTGGVLSIKWILLSALPSSVSVTVGAGGSAGSQTSAGATGGETLFGDYVFSAGGKGGQSYDGSFHDPTLNSRTSFPANSYGSYTSGYSDTQVTELVLGTSKIVGAQSSNTPLTGLGRGTQSGTSDYYRQRVYGRSGLSAVPGSAGNAGTGYGAGGGWGYLLTNGYAGTQGFCSVITI